MSYHQAVCFKPVFGSSSRILILGTMPGIASLNEAEYYAHPRNCFWDIMTIFTGVDRSHPYPVRLGSLVNKGIALWDVLASCERTGSLDIAIREDSVIPNDIHGLLKQTPSLRTIFFNGQPAAKLYKRHISPQLEMASIDIDYITLPSTSPANASWSFKRKFEAWRNAIEPVIDS